MLPYQLLLIFLIITQKSLSLSLLLLSLSLSHMHALCMGRGIDWWSIKQPPPVRYKALSDTLSCDKQAALIRCFFLQYWLTWTQQLSFLTTLSCKIQFTKTMPLSSPSISSSIILMCLSNDCMSGFFRLRKLFYP